MITAKVASGSTKSPINRSKRLRFETVYSSPSVSRICGLGEGLVMIQTPSLKVEQIVYYCTLLTMRRTVSSGAGAQALKRIERAWTNGMNPNSTNRCGDFNSKRIKFLRPKTTRSSFPPLHGAPPASRHQAESMRPQQIWYWCREWKPWSITPGEEWYPPLTTDYTKTAMCLRPRESL